MLWFLYFVLAFGFGLGMWEFIVIKDVMRPLDTAALEVARAAGMSAREAYRSQLPRALWHPVAKVWIFAGQLGWLIVPIYAWWISTSLVNGFLHAVGLLLIYGATGAAVGFGIWNTAGGSGR